MRSITSTSLAALVLGLGLSAASAQTIRFGHVDPAEWTSSKKGAAAEVFKMLVEGESDLTVELFPAGSLGNENELIEQAQEGLTQVVMVSGAMSRVCRAAQVLDVPFTFADATVAWSVLDGPFGDELAEHCLEESGLRTLAYGETGVRHFTNNTREVRNPSDMEGLKFRVQPIPLYVEMVNALGAEPTPVPWTEVPNALATGLVDGQENPVGVIYGNNLHQLQKHLTLSGHVYATDFLVINDEFFQSLSEQEQAVVARAATVAGTVGRAIQQFNSAQGLSAMASEGVTVYAPTAEELGQFRELAQPAVLEWLREELGDDAEWIDRLQAALDS
ncbi:DctP family TRAP transporter solute-binding subunit [Roseinatronobacter bogoriensis]|uniref:C4-dicarboxylate ABC transporter substrate-binding protein n=1 Tax=Roseinatronobacter bogoriensis subsp. barguzinensis TaxID=441209 RepID=A0A2K8KA96_9RHOB|nr:MULTISPECIES: DctP family TRAP transporter solute-binding subunit [Rhodobaca]ATX64803.1 C4-dicarboxylate ABC transporter substrate-binding protein [Rhodobaca barguzinensis]MBB4208591.1 tripartite ATP-independent transporter DctP family solute receptor [Rhodobaca bogoriensis DSM 18756]TDW38140.1 tripartite ATP-independent transporter DctP family solute receptor [Rhodobaca barguzinensis]TDY69689.1 tripartite ATP-independent transporter DctP family solute receptor [Rhodobaca bogoriensis DSM 187